MEPLEPDDPRQIGEYRVVRRLGAGGMGRVYLGRTAGGRTVAVKVVRSELAEDAEFRARFRQEVAAARLVGGRWTAPVLDADTESRRPWVATGYVVGPALGTAVRGFGPLPPDSVRALGVGLAQALAAVHALGLVHRDVKPSNVLLALDGPRLIDFGIARALDAATALTRSGFVVGSPGYMSPEQAQGTVAGPPSDVFSLGAVLAYAASGLPPFGEGVSAAVMIYKVLYEDPDLGELGERDPELRAIVLDCLVKDPVQRLTPAGLAQRLDAGGQRAAHLREGAWLPGALSAAVGRQAVELLDLDHGPEHSAAHPTSGATETRIATSLGGGGGAGGGTGTGTGTGTPVSASGGPTGSFGAPTASAATPPPGWTSGTQATGHQATGYQTTAYGNWPPPGAPSHPGPPQAYGPAASVPPRRTGRRVALVAVVVAVSVAATVGLMRWLGDDSHGSGAATAATPPAARAAQQPATQVSTGPSTTQQPAGGQSSTGDTPSGGSVPTAILGTWTGMAPTSFGSTVGVEVVIVQGNAGETVEHTTVSYPGTNISCTGQGVLLSASGREIIVRNSNASTNAMCAGAPTQVTYRLNTSGTLQAGISTGSAELTRQG